MFAFTHRIYGFTMSFYQDLSLAQSYAKFSYKIYVWIRLLIIRSPIIDVISSEFPKEGRVLDLGCGIGIFTLKFAKDFEKLVVKGIDINAQRIAEANAAALKQRLNNISFGSEDLRKHQVNEPFDVIYMIDFLHHLPRKMVPDFLKSISGALTPNGKIIIKEIRSRPYFKVLFTRLLDKLMAPQDEPYYWPEDEIKEIFQNLGFSVKVQVLPDILPFPHVLYVASRS